MQERMSYSRAETYSKCPYQYYLRYREGLKTYPKYDPQDPLIVGNAFHMSIEQSPDKAVEWYKTQYPIMSDLHVEEMMKLYKIGRVARDVVYSMCGDSIPIFEYGVRDEEYEWVGYMDCLILRKDGTFTLLDFKYSSSVDRYTSSPQLAIYRHMLKRQGYTVKDMYFIVAPKINIRRKNNEDTEDFRRRLFHELDTYGYGSIHVVKPMVDSEKCVREFVKLMKEIRVAEIFPRNETKLCAWCSYQRYCESNGNDLTDIEIQY